MSVKLSNLDKSSSLLPYWSHACWCTDESSRWSQVCKTRKINSDSRHITRWEWECERLNKCCWTVTQGILCKLKVSTRLWVDDGLVASVRDTDEGQRGGNEHTYQGSSVILQPFQMNNIAEDISSNPGGDTTAGRTCLVGKDHRGLWRHFSRHHY